MTAVTDPKMQRVAEATQRLEVAQTELAAAMAELTVADHADTTYVTERLRVAFAEVAAAKTALASVILP